jgi:superfamily II DNA or RNA helicase
MIPTSARPAPLREIFGERLYSAAEQLVARGAVLDVRILQGGAVVTGVVETGPPADRAAARYRVYIRRSNSTSSGSPEPGTPGGFRKIDGECSCSERSPCVHVVAVSIAAETGASAPMPAAHRRGSVAGVATALSTDRSALANAQPQRPAARPVSGIPTQQQRLLYLLDRSGSTAGGRSNGVRVSLWVGQTRSTGDVILDSIHPFALRPLQGGTDFPRYVAASDKEILRALGDTGKTPGRAGMDAPWNLAGENAGSALRQIVATGRAFWQSLRGRALHAGEPRNALFGWQALPNGDQELRCEAGAAIEVFLDIEPALYLDCETGEAGRLESQQPLELLRRYWQQPPVTPEQVMATNEQIFRDAGTTFCPTLRTFPVQQRPLSTLTARLILSPGPAAALYFVYNGLAVDSGTLQDERATVRRMMDGVLYEIPRDHDVERRLRERLACVLPSTTQDREAWLGFMLDAVATLEADNWEISVLDGFPYRIAGTDGWYGDLETDRRQGWFDLRLGVVVDGQPVNLLPALAHYLQTSLAGGQTSMSTDTAAEPNLPQGNPGCRVGERWLVLLDDGRYLPIAIERIQRIANTLVELFDRDGLNRQQAVSLPASHIGRVAQLSSELNGPVLRTADSAMRALLDDLESGRIEPQPAPPHFRAELRPYQQEGLGWLQFLRRHRLGGILADDMGLGKTVQTLAHLALEKQHGRLRRPALIVAPVSTLGNWHQELHRFAPELSGLVLHGSRRRESFALIDNVDVVITGYTLLQLDSETLLARDYSVIILDEAQTIKNPRAKVSAMARSLRAEHRLALTGTPVENHLGELWSLFDFVQPGLLGEERQFQRHYRTPIEKDGNRPRAQALAQRVAPFLLRRTKDAVAKDLPPKTEIVETLALDERQRDFYDGIRLASHRHIQEVVKQQGLARSQITILDALLKLRQACCDPRLPGVAAAQEDVPSAKLEWLCSALPELIAEGRRVLLFSQFTSMLRLIEAAVTALGIPYCLLTGETQNRSEVIARFQSGAVPLFLISLKAGGTGLNLTAADTVIHYDPWWNPAVEAQATDRAHRIGQDKPVFVYKLIAQGTVEERIMQLQADKHALASRLYTESTGTAASWTAADIEALFAP